MVERLTEDGERYDNRVLEVALDEEKAESLQAEARALDAVGGGAIVQKLSSRDCSAAGRCCTCSTRVAPTSTSARRAA